MHGSKSTQLKGGGPSPKAKSAARQLAFCAIFAALAAVGAFIKIPTPLVPITLQTFFVNLAGLLLGSRLGAASVAAYVALGLIGLPVFTGGGGPMYVLYPTFGYLLGFILGAFASGLVVERAKKRSFSVYMGAGLLNLALVYAVGFVYFVLISRFYLGSETGIWTMFFSCCVLVFPGDLLLCILGAGVAKRLDRPLARILGRQSIKSD